MPKKKSLPVDPGGVVVADPPPGAPLLVTLSAIDEDPTQPRQEFDREQLQILADSIAVTGVKQPLLVRPQVDGRWILVDGARRLRAAHMAGHLEVPCVLSGVADWLIVKQDQLIANGMRQDLTVLETAQTLELLWLGHQIAALETEQGVGSTETAALVASAGTPARQIEALRVRLCELSGFPSRDAYLGSGSYVRVRWETVLQAVGMTHMTPDRRKKVLSTLNVSPAAQDALAGIDVSERTLRELAQRPVDEQLAIVEQAQAGGDDVGSAIRDALSASVPAAQPEAAADPAAWEPETITRMSSRDDEAERDDEAGSAPFRLDVDADQRSTFVPDPELAMPLSKGPGQKLVSDRGEIGRGSVPPAGHDKWREDDALKLSSLFEGMLTLLDEVGPAYLTEQHKGWLRPMWCELVGRMEHAGLEMTEA